MAIDFTKPITTDNYSTGVLPRIRDNDLALAKFLEGETITAGLVAGVKRYNATTDLFERYSGSAWAEMPLAYVKLSSYTAADVLTKLLSVDGAGSGVDADLLDGQDGSFYRNAGNLNAGTVPNARISGAYDGITVSVRRSPR